MGQPVAKSGDQVVGSDIHVVLVPSPGGPVPTPMPFPFAGKLDGALSGTVFVDELPVATDGSTATNQPPHVASSGAFQTPPADQATVLAPVGSVLADGRVIARNGDQALTCNDPTDLPAGVVVASGTVLAG